MAYAKKSLKCLTLSSKFHDFSLTRRLCGKQSVFLPVVPAVRCTQTRIWCIVGSLFCFDFFRMSQIILPVFLSDVAVALTFSPPLRCLSIEKSNMLIACSIAALGAVVGCRLLFSISLDLSYPWATSRGNKRLSACLPSWAEFAWKVWDIGNGLIYRRIRLYLMNCVSTR